jgi:hypothetical protein
MQEVEMLRGEINHFLYMVEPRHSRESGNLAVCHPRESRGLGSCVKISRLDSRFRGNDDLRENVPAFIGGTESFDPEVALHCPGCGAKLTGESLDFHTGTAHCESCAADFAMENATAYRIEAMPDALPEFMTVEKTDDSLTMRYVR